MNATLYERPVANLSHVEPAELTKALSARICIITSAPICCNPRVVKEADALDAAGFEVRVVASQHVPWVVEWDEQMMKGRSWKLDAVKWDGSDAKSKWTRLKSGVRQKAFQALVNGQTPVGISDRAYSRLYTELLKKVLSQPSDFLIAHNPPALPVAAAAAKKLGVKFAFDSEDFHTGEFVEAEQSSSAFELLSQVESVYLPQCAYVSAPSDQIAEALQARYKIAKTAVLPNVFCWSERDRLDGQVKDRRGDSLSLYWYSQIVGLDRGLQDVIRAAGLLSSPVQIHVRGDASDEVKTALIQLARECGVADQLYFHEPVRPEELLARATEHDVGLALEQPVRQNHDLTVSNKLFLYMLAGINIAATATEGQKRVMEQSLDAGFLYPPGDYKSLALELQRLIDSPGLLEERKRAALRAAGEKWNWESRSSDLINLVKAQLSPRQEPLIVV
ncbi:MAG TPA: glycosyltransferase [Pyrinomonadaceae bacterium]|nr:glycosyltransferase [Pyrinomonadaceae bacterium]